MGVKNSKLATALGVSGTDWSDGDILYAVDQNGTFDGTLDFAIIQQWRNFVQGSLNTTGIIRHSSTTYSIIDTSGDIHQSTDSLVSTTSKNTAFAGPGLIKMCDADPTRGIAVEIAGTGATAFTSDSGATWTSTTAATFGTQINDVSFPTSGLIVIAGDDGGGAKHIVFSTDNGATWTDATTSPSVAIRAISMFDGTTGYAVDSSTIWKTTDSAVTWTDTGDSIAGSFTDDSSMYSISATTVVFIGDTARISTYDNSTNTVTLVLTLSGFDRTLGVVKTTQGNYYTGWSVASNNITYLAKSTDGLTWSQMMRFDHPENISGGRELKSSLCEFETDNLVFGLGKDPFWKIKENEL